MGVNLRPPFSALGQLRPFELHEFDPAFYPSSPFGQHHFELGHRQLLTALYLERAAYPLARGEKLDTHLGGKTEGEKLDTQCARIIW